jgi:hypothetical protein
MIVGQDGAGGAEDEDPRQASAPGRDNDGLA